MENEIKKIINESISVKQQVILTCLKDIKAIVELCVNIVKNNGKVILCGNGGSAADSQHIAAEFVVRFKKDRNSLPALALTTNGSILTAIGNDYEYDKVFSRQLESLANKNDVLIAISTSGKSRNIIEAVKKAKQIGLKTIAFTGIEGKKFAKLCDLALVIPSSDTARIQESHICVGHIICDLVENSLH